VLYALICRGIDVKFSFKFLMFVLIHGDQGGECWSLISTRLGLLTKSTPSALIEGSPRFLGSGLLLSVPIRSTGTNVHCFVLTT
jgi:hypothetical protein